MAGTAPARPYAEINDENEGLRRSLTEALEQQTATSEILAVISRSPTDVQPVFDAIAQNAVVLCGGTTALVLRFDGEMLNVAGHHAMSPEGIERNERAFPRRPGRDYPPGRAFLDRSVVHVPDLQSATEFAASTARQRGAGSQLAIPLLHGQEAIGVIGLARNVIGPFSTQQISLLKTFADQAVIAVENVRLFKELEARNRDLTTALDRQTATSDVLRIIAQSPAELQPVLDAIATSAQRLCAASDVVIERLEGDRFYNAAHSGIQMKGLIGLSLPLTRGFPGGRAILDRKRVVYDDAQLVLDEFPDTRELNKLNTIHSFAEIPLLSEGRPLGSMAVLRAEVRPFTETEISLLETFADQAVIAIENVRLFKELQERNNDLTESLARQTATSEVLRVISQSPTDLQPVFDTIAANAQRLLRGWGALVVRFDGQLLHVAGLRTGHGSDAAEEAVRRRFPQSARQGTLSGAVVRDRVVKQIADVEAEDEWISLREHARELGWRANLGIPMLHDGQPIGAISVTRREPGAFSPQEVELLKTFADQAVIAIENVRLFKELQSSNSELRVALEQQTATSEILRVISSSPTDVQPVFETILESALQLCGGVTGAVFTSDGEQLDLGAGASTSEEVRRRYPHPLSRKTLAGRAILDNAVVHVPDVEAPGAAPEATITLARMVGYRSALVAPMVREGRPIGAIFVARREPEPFSENQIALLQTFADQAVIAIENVRLFNETKEALEQQTATSEILRVISGSPTDAQPVFEGIARSGVQVLGALGCAVFVVEGDTVRVAATHNVRHERVERFRTQFPAPFNSNPEFVTAVREGVFHLADIEHNPDATPEQVEFARLAGYRTRLMAPMMRGDSVLGIIAVTREAPTPFPERQVELLKTFADQAVIAIENVRLFTELDARTQDLTRSVGELRALGEVGQAIGSTLDLRTVLSTIVARATELSGTDAGVIYEYDEQRQIFVPRATEHLEAEIVETMLATPVRKGEGVTGQLADIQEPIQVPDILAVPAESRVRGALVRAGYRALLAVPLVRENHLLGGLTVVRKATGAFAPEVIELLRTFATQSALAIQNARLFREIEDKSRQLEVASQHKSEFLANMSHELRTPLNAIIGFSEVLSERMFGDLNEKQEEYLKDIYASGTHLLSLINDILDLSKIEAGRMELELTDFDLPTALENALILVRERAGRRSITLRTSINERLGEVRADERKIRQVVLNLLSNAIKFTPEGGRIEVRAVPVDRSVEVSVTDTGVGIAPEDQEAVFEEFRQVGTADKKAEGTGLGLTLCRKFIELHRGRIWVTSQVGVGSTFTFTIPVRCGE